MLDLIHRTYSSGILFSYCYQETDQSQFFVLVCFTQAFFCWHDGIISTLLYSYTIIPYSHSCVTVSILPVLTPPAVTLYYKTGITWNHLFIYSTNIYWALYVHKAFISSYFLRSYLLSPISLKQVIKNCEQKGTVFSLPQNSTHLDEGQWLSSGFCNKYSINWVG